MRGAQSGWLFVSVALIAALTACEKRQRSEVAIPGPAGDGAAHVETGGADTETTAFRLTSPAFKNGEAIPKEYTCDGRNVSPPLAWENPPKGTVAFALIVDDPDAPRGTFTHWVIFNIAGGDTGLPAEVAAVGSLENGALQGSNSARRIGYMGPCPPSGTHRYYFRLYALHTKLDVKAGADRASVESAMKGHILGETELMGTYSR